MSFVNIQLTYWQNAEFEFKAAELKSKSVKVTFMSFLSKQSD